MQVFNTSNRVSYYENDSGRIIRVIKNLDGKILDLEEFEPRTWLEDAGAFALVGVGMVIGVLVTVIAAWRIL